MPVEPADRHGWAIDQIASLAERFSGTGVLSRLGESEMPKQAGEIFEVDFGAQVHRVSPCCASDSAGFLFGVDRQWRRPFGSGVPSFPMAPAIPHEVGRLAYSDGVVEPAGGLRRVAEDGVARDWDSQIALEPALFQVGREIAELAVLGTAVCQIWAYCFDSLLPIVRRERCE